jgi:hypothetical protein
VQQERTIVSSHRRPAQPEKETLNSIGRKPLIKQYFNTVS